MNCLSLDVDQTGAPLTEEPIDAEVAVGSGYSESKWVSEKILEAAKNKTSLKPVIVRVGQLSGGENGAWNESEWLPSIVRSAPYVKCLPVSSEVRIYTTYSSSRLCELCIKHKFSEYFLASCTHRGFRHHRLLRFV